MAIFSRLTSTWIYTCKAGANYRFFSCFLAKLVVKVEKYAQYNIKAKKCFSHPSKKLLLLDFLY